jgi:hypothetical protein
MIVGPIIPDIIPEEKKPLEPPMEIEEFEEDDYFQLLEMITL